ncbi:MAG TPA: SRPBCC domain-containing protein [Steroidobacteraceae bacterium]
MVDLKHQVPINAPAARVFAAVATAEGNRGWWTADSAVDARVGGKAEFGFDKRAVVFNMRIDRLVPDQEVAMSCTGGPPEWTGTTLRWRIESDGKQSVLRFTHGGWKELDDYCAGCNSTWGRLMYRLRDYVESGKADPQWTG